MGMWGFEPWEDDLAADWLAELFEKGKIAERVVKAMQKQDVEEYWPEIRAAAHVIAALGDVWPPDRLKADHQLAIDRLEAVKQCRDFQGDNVMQGEIDAQIGVLRGRLEAASAVQTATPSRAEPNDAFAKLKSPDPAMRLAGLAWISKSLCAVTRWSDQVWGDPHTMEAHLPLLDDADPDVADLAICNVSFLIQKHSDDRILPAALRLMRSPRPRARCVAARVAMQLAGNRSLEDVLRLFEDPDKGVRAAVIHDVQRECRAWSKEARDRLRTAALAALGDRSDEVRVYAARLLFRERGGMASGDRVPGVGRPEDLAAVKKARAGIKAANWKRALRELLDDVFMPDAE
jgi:hypothetical protein